MKNKIHTFLLFALSFSLSMSSCKKDEEPTPAQNNNTDTTTGTEGLTFIEETYAIGAATKVQLWAGENLFTGYNYLYVMLKDSLTGLAVKKATVTLMPMMDMGSMTHSAPVENPTITQSVKGKYPCAVVFVMPSTAGTWSLSVMVMNMENGKSGTALLMPTITDPSVARMKSFISLIDGSKLFVSLVKPSSPVSGINDCEITMHKKDGMYFFADSSFTNEMEPIMTAMGHSSPNNISPVHSGKGHYSGQVNFSMSGEWTINFDFYQNGILADSLTYFETTIP
ncbi:MAG TPA: FixH family protein [Bacteroidia bacterium]|nr:FixH family protein [Bacteroidia bacterium]